MRLVLLFSSVFGLSVFAGSYGPAANELKEKDDESWAQASQRLNQIQEVLSSPECMSIAQSIQKIQSGLQQKFKKAQESNQNMWKNDLAGAKHFDSIEADLIKMRADVDVGKITTDKDRLNHISDMEMKKIKLQTITSLLTEAAKDNEASVDMLEEIKNDLKNASQNIQASLNACIAGVIANNPYRATSDQPYIGHNSKVAQTMTQAAVSIDQLIGNKIEQQKQRKELLLKVEEQTSSLDQSIQMFKNQAIHSNEKPPQGNASQQNEKKESPASYQPRQDSRPYENASSPNSNASQQQNPFAQQPQQQQGSSSSASSFSSMKPFSSSSSISSPAKITSTSSVSSAPYSLMPSCQDSKNDYYDSKTRSCLPKKKRSSSSSSASSSSLSSSSQSSSQSNESASFSSYTGARGRTAVAPEAQSQEFRQGMEPCGSDSKMVNFVCEKND